MVEIFFEIWGIAPGGLRSHCRKAVCEEDWQFALKLKKRLEESGYEEVRIVRVEVPVEDLTQESEKK